MRPRTDPDATDQEANQVSEAGFTLVEMMVTTALLMVVLAMVLPLIASSLNLFTNTSVRSDAVDNAQLAFNQIGRDVVSSNILYQDPATQIVHLQTFLNSGPGICAEYQVVYPASPAAQVGTLERRTKAPGASIAYTGGWGNVMGGIVNTQQSGNPLVFTVSPPQDKSLVVDLWVQLDTNTGPTAAAPENFTSTFTGPAIPAGAAAAANPSSEPC
jgi:type II secretory pathway pseudopilin PulG